MISFAQIRLPSRLSSSLKSSFPPAKKHAAAGQPCDDGGEHALGFRRRLQIYLQSIERTSKLRRIEELFTPPEQVP
jgi:hypothetical protein